MAIRSAGDFGEPGELEGTPSLVEDSWLTVSFSASFSRMLVFLRANRSFRGVFRFSDGDAKVCVCVCVCVYVYVINSLSCLNEKKWKKI